MKSPAHSRCVLAIDQGTTSSRAILFDARGLPLATAQEEFPQHARICTGPDGEDLGIVEHDAEDIWNSQIACCRRVLDMAGIHATQVAAIGVTNQRETTILWDKASGRPVAPAIVWQSKPLGSVPRSRAAPACGSTPTSRRRRSCTSWRQCPVCAIAAPRVTCSSAPSTRSSSGD